MTMHRTRIKFCGLTRAEDVRAAVAAGADAIGLVFYAGSPRYVPPSAAAKLMLDLPPFVSAVGLFVNATAQDVAAAVELAPVSMLQFHGDESIEQCSAVAQAVNRPFLRAIRMRPDMAADDLLKYEQSYRAASHLFAGLLLDTWSDAYGGAGKVFDWSVIPEELSSRVVLSGGLNAQNAAEAVRRVRPHALDVSSGIELAKGIKDSAKMRSFAEAVRAADAAADTADR